MAWAGELAENSAELAAFAKQALADTTATSGPLGRLGEIAQSVWERTGARLFDHDSPSQAPRTTQIENYDLQLNRNGDVALNERPAQGFVNADLPQGNKPVAFLYGAGHSDQPLTSLIFPRPYRYLTLRTDAETGNQFLSILRLDKGRIGGGLNPYERVYERSSSVPAWTDISSKLSARGEVPAAPDSQFRIVSNDQQQPLAGLTNVMSRLFGFRTKTGSLIQITNNPA